MARRIPSHVDWYISPSSRRTARRSIGAPGSVSLNQPARNFYAVVEQAVAREVRLNFLQRHCQLRKLVVPVAQVCRKSCDIGRGEPREGVRHPHIAVIHAKSEQRAAKEIDAPPHHTPHFR